MAATRFYKPSAYSWANNAVNDYMKGVFSATTQCINTPVVEGSILPNTTGVGITWPGHTMSALSVKRVIHNPPATIVIWEDNTKTVAMCGDNDKYDEYFGFCVALAKRVYGTFRRAKKESQKWTK